MSETGSLSEQANPQSLPDPATESRAVRLSVAGVSKSYSGIEVLRDIAFDVREGEIVALLGENGAGKSTLSAIIAGTLRPSAGTMSLEGRPYAPASPRAAIEAGVGLIQQEIRLLPDLSIAENVFIGQLPMRAGRVDHARMRMRAYELLLRLGLNASPRRLVRTLGVAAQQQVEIAKALNRNARLLILDEPTTALACAETEQLFAHIAGLKADGVSFIYISHRLDEVARIADRIIVLRDGELVARYATANLPVSVLLRDMLGRDIKRLFPVAEPPRAHEVLRVEGLTSATGAFRDIGFSVRAGEIFGVAGIVGAGCSELVRSIIGAEPLAEGRILLDGKPLYLASPHDAIRAGVALVPEDRKTQGLILRHSVGDNLALGNFDRVAPSGWLWPGAKRRLAERLIDLLGIRGRPEQGARYLSGGNQQKLVIARWVAREPRVLILDGPTRGIDVGARAAIYNLIADLARAGMVVVLVSPDLEEVLGLSHRVLVLSRGRQITVLNAADADAVAVMALATM